MADMKCECSSMHLQVDGCSCGAYPKVRIESLSELEPGKIYVLQLKEDKSDNELEAISEEVVEMAIRKIFL